MLKGELTMENDNQSNQKEADKKTASTTRKTTPANKRKTPAKKTTASKPKTANERLAAVMEDIRLTDEGKIELNGKKYTTVAKRNEVFRREFGFDVSTITEILHMEGDLVVMKATICLKDENGEWVEVATGHAEENRSQSQMNSVSALENAETSAIGRALSNMGLSGGEFSSFDETSGKMAQSGKKAEQTKKMANQYQLKAINKEIDGSETLRNKYFEKYNVDSIEKLTYSQAANLIKDLQSEQKKGDEGKDEPTIL